MSSNREVQQIGYDYLVDEGNIKLELENIPDDREFIPDYDASIKIVQTISPLSVNYQENKKILLTNHHLENYAGSELVTFELAKEFQSKGWDVYVATFSYGGNMKELFEKNDISVFNILNESLLTKDFDLVWGHHFPVLYKCFFKDQIKTKNLVLSSLSPYEPLESIVHLHEESNAVIFNSQETYNHHIQYFEKFASKFQVFPNSVGQEYFEKSKNSFNHDIKKIAIVSNHAPPEVMEAIEKLEAKNIEVIFVGQQQKSQLVDSALLMSCDVVITIGRTVQHCMALKVPVFVYDHFGGPGWLNDTNLKEVEWFNYSGRCCRNKLSVDEIIRDIFSGYKSALENLPFFYNYAQEKYNLSNNISNILNRLNFEKQGLIKKEFSHNHRWDNLCRNYYDIYSRNLGNLHYYIAQLQESQSQLQEFQSQLQEFQSQLQESQSQLQESQSQLQESQCKLQQIQSQLEESQSKLDIAQLEMVKIRRSRSWRLTMPLRIISMLLRGQFTDVIEIGFSFLFSTQKSDQCYQMSRFYDNFTHIPKLFSKFGQRSEKAIKQIIAGRSDLVLTSIIKILNNTNTTVEESSFPTTTISTDNVVILATKHTLYIAHLLQKALVEVGCHAVLCERFSDQQDVGQLHFVICPQMFLKLPRNFVAFQMEQSVSSRWFTLKYFADLKNAYTIFDYSVKNIEFLLENDFLYQKIFYLPIGSFSGYLTYLSGIGYQIKHTAEPIDVLFYGDPNCERRQTYLARLKSEFNVYVASEVFGEDLVSLISRAKVVVNVHYYESALLETTRIYETLSLGTPIVSESSIDIDSHCDLDGIVSFTPIGDIDAMILELRALLADDLQRQRRFVISEFVEHDHKFSHYFKRFLLSNDLFNYNLNAYEQEVNFISSSKLDVPRLCLSLTETPMRRYAFLAKPTNGFEIVEGIRHYKGWIGCGMSYKYILNNVRQLGSKYAIICEDDVIFPDNFEKRIGDVISYLQQTKRQWHIFAGLIADMHKDTNILAIENYDGMEYIYIDKMTGMVMNIYSPEMMEIIGLWDETNNDVKTNTIDRYIESQTELVVVTTLPYLVGHAEDQKSTLWGFVNTEYLEMIQKSQQILADKVRDYKANLNLSAIKDFSFQKV